MYATPEDIRARYKEVYPLLAGKDAEGRRGRSRIVLIR